MLRFLIFVLVTSASAAACGPPELSEWNASEHGRWRTLDPGRSGGEGFSAISARRSGIAFENRLARETAMDHDHLLVGSGVAIGDFDGDGLADVYLPRLEGPNALYRNLGGLRFEDVTAAAGVAAPDRYSTGASFVDVDGDADLDLFVTALGGPDALFVNEGGGRFSNATDRAGLSSDLGSTSATFADVDGDGDLDLYVVRYKVESAADVLRPYEQASVDLVVDGPDGPRIAEPFREHFRMEMRDGVSVAMEQADPDRLYLNRGDGTFEAVPWDDGRFRTADGYPLTRDLDDFGLAARFYDVDDDGDVDLYVCNDFDDPDRLWLNQGDGSFVEAPALALRTTSHAAMAVDFADIDRDGAVDFFVADMLSADPGRRLAQVPLHAGIEKPVGRIDDRPQVGRNTLFLGRGDGTWAQIAEMAGVDGSEWTWGSVFVDVDLDGWEDLLVVNGHGRDMRDGDALSRIQNLRGSVTWNEAKSLYPDLPTRNRAFRNRGDLTFEDHSEAWGFGEEADVSHGIALGDLDGDGDLDVVVNRLNEPVRLLRNEASAPRVAVRLRGEGPNVQGVGANVRLLGGAVPSQERQVTSGGLYLSGSEASLTFAAGEAATGLRLQVEWPSGRWSDIPVEANRLYEVTESSAGPRPEDSSALVEPLFEDMTATLDARHSEDDFDDRARQPTLSRSMARLGPGLSWIDVDADRDADLLVPAGKGGRLTVYRNDSGGFRPQASQAADHDQLTVLPGSRAGSLLVSRSSYDASDPDEARALEGVVSIDASGTVTPVAEPSLSSAGAMAQADVDGDGDLDLFVAGRVIPAFAPLPATSRLYLAEGAGFQPVAVAAFEELGLVSGAVFSDLDDDGDPDLALAVEWGAVRVFENTGTGFVDRTAAYGLADKTGLWRGITAGDWNGDGRMDLAVSNEGRNTRLATSEDRPLTLVHSDVDQSGTWDVLLARTRRSGGPLQPLSRYEIVRPAVPGMNARVPSFMEYGDATVADVFGAEANRFFQLPVTTLEHGVFLQTDEGFDWRPLPTIAQIAPAHGIGVADIDGDGREDLALGQNFFPTDPFTPRYDAGISLVLLGDGAGGFTPLTGSESGVRVYGDARGLAFSDYDGDARVDLAIAQNGAEVRLFRNRGAAPGVRVRLEGPPANPTGIGARVRLRYDDGVGPWRELRSGQGYASVDDPVVVLGLRSEPVAVEVRWPDGSMSEEPAAPAGGEVVARHPSGV